MKKLITSMLIVLLLCVAFIGSFYKGYYCYALENEDSYRALTDDELDAALYSYIQSRGGGLSAITYEAMHTYNRGKIDNAIFGDGAEYSRSDLLGHIHVGKNQNDGMYFDFDGIAAGFLNTRFRKMLQDKVFGEDATLNENGMLNSGVDEILYSGKFFLDDDGNGCFLYSTNGTSNTLGSLVSIGTNYLYPYSVYKQCVLDGTTPANVNTHIFNKQYDFTYSYLVDSRGSQYENYRLWGYIAQQGNSSTQSVILANYRKSDGAFNNVANQGIYCIAINNQGRLFLCKSFADNSGIISLFVLTPNTNVSADYSTTDINFYTNINNNIINYPDINADGHLYISPKVKINGEYSPYTVNNNQTINQVINNYYNDGSEKDKTITVPSDTPPTSGGGGSGGGSGGTPPNWSNPYPNLSPDGNGGFNFNFTLPDLNIDWNINGLSEKFPFSIPFDLIRFVSVLNAEPETPHFEGTVNLIVYEWNIDADLSDFDNLAGIVRNVEFIGFCITLILITRRMIKG